MTRSVTILTGDGLRHSYFVSGVAEHFRVTGVVREPVYVPKTSGSEQDRTVLQSHFSRRDSAEKQYFLASRGRPITSGEVLDLEKKGDINLPEVREWIVSRSPDLLLLYGCSVIQAELIDAFPGRCVNMHLGLSPYYRGSATNFWPLVNREPELVGATIHLATRKIDAGDILKQVRPSIADSDDNHDIGCKAIIAGIDTLIAAVEDYKTGRRTPVKQEGSGRYYRRSDFSAEAVMKMRHQFETGMIPEFLAGPERIKDHPIVE